MQRVSRPIAIAVACIEGALPAGLVGTFLRIGPNPAFDFEDKPYHVFDGKPCRLAFGDH